MPIDSASKRGSAIHVGMPWRGNLPIPDGTIGQGDRQHVVFMYSGILAGTLAVSTGPIQKVNPVQKLMPLSLGRV